VKLAGLLSGFLLVLSGCATPQTDHLLAEGYSMATPKAEITGVPFYPQEGLYCGPAALAMALSWSGDPVRPGELVPLMYTPAREGTLQTEVLTAARRHGRVAYPVFSLEDLLREVAAGHPIVVLQNLGLSWYPRWHYAVVVGYDLSREEIILHSGLEARVPMPLRLFERTWARGNHWATLVLPPGVLPAGAGERSYLASVVGLERAGQWEAASKSYAAALQRWPRSIGALMGLGNSRYALGDLPGAEQAFRAAIRFHPADASAYNNLAQVLADGGRRREALLQVETAITLGGPMRPFFLKTREKIQAEEGAPRDEDLPVLEKRM
jgi:hypothetical protein